MDSKIVLTQVQVEDLILYVEGQLDVHLCDHSLKWTLEWAKLNHQNFDDLIDVLDENGCFCDCEVILNVPEEGNLILEEKVSSIDLVNPFKIPIAYEMEEQKVYSKAIIGINGLTRQCYAKDGEFLFPAPQHYKPKKRMRKLIHFLNGIETGLPSELGIVKTIEPITANAFAKQLRDSNKDFLKKVKKREADFFLTQVASFELNTIVGVDLLERLRNYKMQTELKIHRVILK